MKYIVNKRLKKHCLCGEVNLPYGSKCEEYNHIIYCNDRALCYDTSQDAYDYLSRDDDGNGLKRGDLVHAIIDLLAKHDDKHQDRWNKLWDNETIYGIYRRKDHEDHWLWNHRFYNAELKELENIYNLIKI